MMAIATANLLLKFSSGMEYRNNWNDCGLFDLDAFPRARFGEGADWQEWFSQALFHRTCPGQTTNELEDV